MFGIFSAYVVRIYILRCSTLVDHSRTHSAHGINLIATPKAIWPLTDKYSNPGADLTANGHDATLRNLAPGFETFPGTGTHAYRFSGTQESYFEVTMVYCSTITIQHFICIRNL